MSAVPMLPAGPKDCEQRLAYLNGRGGIELKTGRIGEGDWARKTAETVKGWGGPVTWHIPDVWVVGMGFSDFDMDDFLAKVAVIDPLIEAGLIDALVCHCGSLRWLEGYDPSESFEQRYVSRFTASEILIQIERHIPRFARLVERYGGSHILVENTSLALARELKKAGSDGQEVFDRLVNFLAPQIGTFEAVCYIARHAGTGVTMDTGHFSEYFSLVRRLYDQNVLPINTGEGLVERADVQGLYDIAGYINRFGTIPYVPECFRQDLLWHIRHSRINLFHLDACRASIVDGMADNDRPILTDEDAKIIHLDEIIRVAKANNDCLGLVVENVGSDVWPTATERPTDWEGKRLTFEFLERAIAL